MPASESVQVYLGIILLCLFPVCAFVVLYYAEPGFPFRTYCTTILGYYASFGILLVVPIDIAAMVFNRLSTDSDSEAYHDDRKVLSSVYNTFFTMVLILGSFVLILEEYFNSDGYFTFKTKCISTFKRMLWDNGPGAIAGAIVLAILIGQKVVASTDALMLAAVIVTNTVYETFLMFLLGYALVEYPRAIWHASDLDKYLLMVQQRASAEFKSIQDAQLSVSLCVSDVLKTSKMINSHTPKEVQDAMAILVAECPSEFRSDRMGTVAADKKGQITIDTLAHLRTRLNLLRAAYKSTQAKVEGTKILAYTLEDIVNAKNDPGANTIHWSLYDTDSTPQQYNWHIKTKPMLLKAAAVFAGILSVFSFLGVICSMGGVENEVSVYFLAVHDTEHANRGGIALFILITLGYTVAITTWALFQMRIAGAMELQAGRTTPMSLSFNVRMNARLAAPLAFFYLGWMAENGIKAGPWLYNEAPDYLVNTTFANVTTNPITNVTTTTYYNGTMWVDGGVFMPSAFSDFYQLQSVGAIKSTFGTIFPVLLFCVLFLFITNAFNRLLVLIKMEEYQFGAPLVTEEQLREGKRQLQRNKKATERTFRRDALKSFIAKVGIAKDNEGNGGIIAWLFGGKSRESRSARESADEVSEKIEVKEPTNLAAKVEKKSTKGASGKWKECWAEVRSPGFLHFYKDKKTATEAFARSKDPSTSTDKDALVIDLKNVMDFTIPDRKNKDNACVDFELGHNSIRVKFASHEEAVLWKHKLQEWKDFNMDFGTTYPYGLAAGSINGSGGVKNPIASASSSNKSSIVSTKNPPPSAPSAKDDYDFDNMQIDDHSDDEDKGGTKNSSSSSYGGKASKSPAKGAKNPSAPITKPSAAPSKKSSYDDDDYGYGASDDKPEMLEGWVEKKGGGRVKMGSDWQRRYMRIDEKHQCLSYYKSSAPGESPAGMIDLKIVKDITPYEKAGAADFSRFNIDLEDKVYKFKVNSQSEGQRWVDGLNEWRDYFLMNMA